MLADQTDDYIDQYCEWMEKQEPLTGNTISDSVRLRNELIAAKLNGYASDNGEIEKGLICVAAPIRDITKRVIAAVSISGPDYRMEEDLQEMISAVKKAAEQVSYMLGYRK